MALTKKMINKTVSVDSTDQVNNNDKYLESKVVAGTSVEINKIADGYGYKLEITVPVPFVIDTFTSTSGSMLEVGQTLATPIFNATYSRLPISVALTDTDGYYESLSSPFATITSAKSHIRTTSGQTLTCTLTAYKGALSNTNTKVFTWGSKVFWGVAVPATYNEAFIEALASNSVQTSKNKTFTVTPGATKYIYFACKTSYGTPTFIVGGFEGGFTKVGSAVSVTNSFGITETYDLWKSEQLDLGTTTVGVS